MPVPPPVPPPVPGTQWSALDFIKSAMRLIGALGTGETPSGDEGNDACAVLNQMLDSANAEGMMIFTRNIKDFAFVGGQQVYTLGTGGNFDYPRPPYIERASVMLNNGMPNQLEVAIALYTDQDWQRVSIKGTDSTFPLSVYDDGSFPFRNLNYWPVPRDATQAIPRLYMWAQLAQFPDIRTVLNFPPAYYEWIKFNLAVRLAPEFQMTLRPEVVALADAATAKIKSFNSADEAISCDLGVAPGPSSRKVRNELFSIP